MRLGRYNDPPHPMTLSEMKKNMRRSYGNLPKNPEVHESGKLPSIHKSHSSLLFPNEKNTKNRVNTIEI